MNKTPDPGEVMREKVIPAAAELVASLAERVAPLTHQAVQAITPFAQQTRDTVAPYAQQAADFVNPYAAQVGPFAQQAAGRVSPLAQQAAVAVAPYAALLREQGLRSSHDLADRLEQSLEAARAALSGARDKVTVEYLPAVSAAAATAAASASPMVTAATERGRALVQGTKTEPVVALPPPKKKRGWLPTLAVVAAAAGATYVVVRRLAGDKGSQWQTARPTTPYEPPVSAEAGVASPTTGPEPVGHETEVVASTTSLYGTVGSSGGADVDDADGTAVAARTEVLDEVADLDEGIDAPSVPTASSDGHATSSSTGSGADAPYSDEKIEMELETVEERAYEEPEDAVWVEQDTATGGSPAEHPERYDLPGTYVGVEPPEGFTIKGNERSMKYHLPDSNSYARTLAQVWFASEEAAQRAGFSRAQH